MCPLTASIFGGVYMFQDAPFYHSRSLTLVEEWQHTARKDITAFWLLSILALALIRHMSGSVCRRSVTS